MRDILTRPNDRQLLRDAFAIGSARLAAVLVSTLQVVVVVRRLTPSAYGVWAAASIVGSVAFLVNAVGGKLITELASALASPQPNDADNRNRKLFVASFMVTAGGCALAAAGVLLVQRWLPWETLINTGDRELLREARLGLVAAFAMQCVVLPFGLAAFVFRAYQDNGVVGAYMFAGSLLSLALVTAATFTPHPLVAAMVAPYVANLVAGTGLFAWLLRRRRWSWVRLAPREAWTLIRPHLGHVAWFATLGAAFAALASSLTYVLSLSRGFAAAGTVDVYLKVFTVLVIVQGEMIMPLWPAYAGRRIAGDWRWIRRRLVASTTASVAAVVGASVVLSLVATPLVRWVTARDVRIDRGTFAGLALYTVSYAAIQAMSTFLNASGRLRTQVAACIAALAGMPMLSIGLGRRYGTAGAVLACAAALGFVAVAMGVRAAVELANKAYSATPSRPAGTATSSPPLGG